MQNLILSFILILSILSSSSATAATILGRLSVLPLDDPKVRLVMGDLAADSYTSQGWDATMFLENTSITEFSNPIVEWTNLEGYLSRGLIGNFGPGHENPGLGYPASTMVLVSWDGYAITLFRGLTYVSRPVDFWFYSDQSIPAYLSITAPYDSVDILAVPEPSTLALFGAGLAAIGFSVCRQRRKA